MQCAGKNIKWFYLSVLLSLFALRICAQNVPVNDSLERLLRNTPTDTAKAMLLYRLADATIATDTVNRFRYIQQGLRLCQQYPYYQGIGYFYLGRIYMDYDEQKSDENFSRSIALLEKTGIPASWLYQSRAWANKAVIAQSKNDNNTYTDLILNKSLPLAEKAGDSLRVAQEYTNLTLPFLNFGNYEKAILYAQKSAAIFRRNQPLDPRQIDNFANLAKIYLLKGTPVSAKIFLDSALNIIAHSQGSLYEPYYYTTEAQYYTNTHQLKEAEQSISKGMAVAQKINNHDDIRTLLYQKARLYEQLNDKKAARDVLLDMYNKGYISTALDRKQVYHDLATMEAGLKNIGTAYEWLYRYAELSDSISEAATKIQIAGLEAKYNYAQKENELLAAGNKIKEQKILMWASVGGLLLASLLFLYLGRMRKYKATQQLHSLKQEQEIALTQALLEGEEKERMRMARDLHDGLGGMLAGVKINLTNALEDDPSSEINRVIAQLDDSVTELRRIARNMMPEALLRSGLETALTDLCLSLSSEKLRIDYSFMNISAAIPKQEQTIIYRIVQELLTNVVKHSGGTEAYVQCSHNETIFYITVEDNGQGLNADNKSRGIGLDNVRSRVDFLKGTTELHSEPGSGTIVNIELKIERA